MKNTDGRAARKTPPGMPVLLTVDEVASVIRKTPEALYAMVARGQLPGVVRIGRRVLVRQSDLLKWLDQKATPSPGSRR
jgi:excisionase family DNA binding protein